MKKKSSNWLSFFTDLPSFSEAWAKNVTHKARTKVSSPSRAKGALAKRNISEGKNLMSVNSRQDGHVRTALRILSYTLDPGERVPFFVRSLGASVQRPWPLARGGANELPASTFRAKHVALLHAPDARPTTTLPTRVVRETRTRPVRTSMVFELTRIDAFSKFSEHNTYREKDKNCPGTIRGPFSTIAFQVENEHFRQRRDIPPAYLVYGIHYAQRRYTRGIYITSLNYRPLPWILLPRNVNI